MRNALISNLAGMMRNDERLFFLTADMGINLVERIQTEFPKRFINVGIAEQNLIGIASGLVNVGYIPIVYTISNFLKCNYEEFEKNFIDLSKKTFTNFKEMLPNNFKKLWIDGIENEDYYLKLCGSGGGGYLIGLTRNLKAIEKHFPDKKIETLYKF